MRVQKIAVGWDVALGMLGGHGMERLDTNLPVDARVLGAGLDLDRQLIYLFVESASFDDIPSGQYFPEFTVIATRHITELAVIADMVSRKHDEPCPNCGEVRTGS